MKIPVVLVAAALTIAILVAASFLIATETRGDNALWRLDQPPRMSSPHDHLWKMKNAPAAMKPKPNA
jgi:hypothetical protein